MNHETFVQYLIYLHAVLGGISLIAGFVAIAVTKGGKVHKQSGKIFFYSLLFSGITALVIANLPGHKSPFLFFVGIFSLYFIISGYRSLNFKNKTFELLPDKILAYGILLSGVIMICYPYFYHGRVNIVLAVMGLVSLLFGVRDLKQIATPEVLRKNWLKLHLGKMLGGYISSVTAFVVVNNFFPGVIGWFLPGVIGGFFIGYWLRKVDRKQSKLSNFLTLLK